MSQEEGKLMNNVNRNYTALAIAAYVFIDVLVRTSQAVWGAVSNVNKASRLTVFDTYEFFGRNLVLGYTAAGLGALSVLLILLLIFYFVRVWSNTMSLTKSLVKFLHARGAGDAPPPDLSSLLKEVLGNDYMGPKAPFWLLFRALIVTWILVILIEFFSNLIPFQG